MNKKLQAILLTLLVSTFSSTIQANNNDMAAGAALTTVGAAVLLIPTVIGTCLAKMGEATKQEACHGDNAAMRQELHCN